MQQYVGKHLSHESARGHVTGSAKYVDDMWPNMGGVVHTWPVLSPHAHARVIHIDPSRALCLDGVLGVFDASDVAGENDTGPVRHDEPLFPSEVQFHGQAVVWVAAETEAVARAAAALVHVQYEALPAVLGIAAAIAGDSFHGPQEVIRRGLPERELASAVHTLSGELEVGGQEHFYLETQAAMAWLDESGGVVVHSSTQHPTETQEIVARVLGLPRSQVVVQCLRMGGAFGGKEVQANTWAAIAAVIANKLKRPTRVRLTRHQDMTMTGKRHPFLGRFEVGFSAAGKLTALKVQLWSDGGYSLDLSSPVLARAMFHLDNCYHLEHVEVVGRVCKTHAVSHTAFRGFGGPQGMIMIEEIMARIAHVCGLPADLVRERNFYREGDTAHYGQPITDAGRIGHIWQELKRTSDFELRRQQVAAHNSSARGTRRGLAITPVKFGISFTTAMFNQAGALVLIYKDGSVQLNHGGTEMGQGLHTKMLQIAADCLGIDITSIRMMPTRTDKVPNTSATAASAGSDLNGAAVLDACKTLHGRLAEVAGRHFSAHPDDVVFRDGHVFVFHNPEASVPFATIVNLAYTERVPLFSTGYYRTPHIHFDAKTGRGKPFHYYTFGAAVSEVEVNGFTGQYRIVAVDILHDVGDSLSPLIDKGQIEGGFMQGVGWLTLEELVWNDQGALATSGASTYKLPSLGECPAHFDVRLLPKAAQPGVVYGSKAVGEPPFMLAFSVREALRDAIAACCDGKGPVELESPATPEAVYWAIQRGSRAQNLASAAQ
jgi:xanthine dehydrogenase large subunit